MTIKEKVKDRVLRCTEWTDKLLIIISIFLCTFFVYKDFGIRMIFGYAILIFILFVHICRRLYFKRTVNLCPLKIVAVCSSVVILVYYLFPTSRKDSDTFAYIVAMVICTFYFLFSSPTEAEIKISIKIVIITALIFGCAIVLFRAFPQLYWSTVYNCISEPSRELADYYMKKGYSIPIGGSYFFADYLLIFAMLASLGFSISNSERKISQIIYTLFASFFIICILLVGRRGELIAAVIACLIAWLICKERKYKRKAVLIFVGICAFCVILVLLFLPLLKEVPFLYRYVSTVEKMFAGEDITSGRTELWEIAWRLFVDNPLFGVGWGGFSGFVTEQFREIHGQDVMNVHNNYLQLLCETGVFGTIIILTPVVYLLIRTIKIVMKTKRINLNNKLMYLNMVSLGMQIFFLVLGLLDPCLYKLIYWCYWAIIIIFSSTVICNIEKQGLTE